MTPINNTFDIKVPGVYIFVVKSHETYSVSVVNVTEKTKDFVTGTRLFGIKKTITEEKLPAMIYSTSYTLLPSYTLSHFNVPRNNINSNAIYPFTPQNYDKLCEMDWVSYPVYFTKNYRHYPTWDEIKDNADIKSQVNNVHHIVTMNNELTELMKMSYDERFDLVMDETWNTVMAELDMEKLCQNPDDETDDYMEFQHTVLGDIAGTVINLIEDSIHHLVVNYYNDRSNSKEATAKLKAALTR